ncbi:MAG: hypothetical protein ACREI9_08465 [Nitrospiraceae bacterium]
MASREMRVGEIRKWLMSYPDSARVEVIYNDDGDWGSVTKDAIRVVGLPEGRKRK